MGSPSAADEAKPRLRIKVACEECRKGKRKCDGQRPICSLCQRSGRACVFVPEESRKRKYQDEDLIQKLQDQIEALKSALVEAKASNRGGRNSFEYNDTDYLLTDSSADPNWKSAPPSEQTVDSRSPVAMEELATLMLRMGVEDRGEPSFTISSGRDTILPWQNMSHQSDFSHDDSASDRARELRPEERKYLIQCFVEHFNPYHQFLSQSEAADLASSENHSIEGIDAVFRMHALLAVSAAFSPRAQLTRLGPLHASAAKRLIFQCIEEQPSDLVVQGLTLLSWREIMFGTPAMAYNLVAMATGQVLHLGLHVGALVQSSASDVISDSLHFRRIRSFWAYFSVDRLVTSSLGMNCTMHWQRVKAPPFLSTISGQPSVAEIAHERFCQLWHLWDSHMDQVYAFGWANATRAEKEALVLRSHQALTAFYHETDDRLHISKHDLSDPVMWLQLSYNASLILVHRPLLNEPSDSSAVSFALRAATTAAASTSRIIRMYRRTKSLATSGPQIIDYILTAAVIHLLNATTGKTHLGRQSANGLRSCLEAFSDMQSTWTQRTSGAIRRIQDLAHRWGVVWALPIQFSQLPALADGMQEETDRKGDRDRERKDRMQNFDTLDDLAMDGNVRTLWRSPSGFDSPSYNDAEQLIDLDWLFAERLV